MKINEFETESEIICEKIEKISKKNLKKMRIEKKNEKIWENLIYPSKFPNQLPHKPNQPHEQPNQPKNQANQRKKLKMHKKLFSRMLFT